MKYLKRGKMDPTHSCKITKSINQISQVKVVKDCLIFNQNWRNLTITLTINLQNISKKIILNINF